MEALSAVSFVGSSGGSDVDTDAGLRDANGSPRSHRRSVPCQRRHLWHNRTGAGARCVQRAAWHAGRKASEDGRCRLACSKKRHQEQMEALVAEGEEEWSLSTPRQKLEAWLRASSCSFVAAWLVDKHVQKSPRFKCLCAGYETRTYRAPVCSAVWTASENHVTRAQLHRGSWWPSRGAAMWRRSLKRRSSCQRRGTPSALISLPGVQQSCCRQK